MDVCYLDHCKAYDLTMWLSDGKHSFIKDIINDFFADEGRIIKLSATVLQKISQTEFHSLMFFEDVDSADTGRIQRLFLYNHQCRLSLGNTL